MASDSTTSGRFSVAPSTLRSLAFDWFIEGDDNRNAKVALAYRKSGESAWRDGMPLFRLQKEDVNAWPAGNATARRSATLMMRPPLNYRVPNMFSGSILNLEEGSEYEVRLTLSDPDGVTGNTVQAATARTRAEPRPAEGGAVYHVYPWDFRGTRMEPSFTGLLAAYYLEARHADWSNASAPRVKPGDVILVHAGVYKDNPQHYNDGVEGETEPRLATFFDGTYYLTADGTADRPIAIKAAGDGEVVFDGGGNAVLFNLMGGDHHYFDGITVRNSEIGFLAGIKNIAGSSGFTLKNSRVENIARGVQTDWSGSRDFYVADNVFVGRHDQNSVMGWTNYWAKYPQFPPVLSGPGGSEYAVKVYGQGHVVAYNDVRYWHDGIDIASYGDPDEEPEGSSERLSMSIDFHNNLIDNLSDNCLEADGGARNIRIFENYCFNAAGGAISVSPFFGGPAYIYRNVAYSGVAEGVNPSITPTGYMVVNNTFIGAHNNIRSPVSNVHHANNLFFSTRGDVGYGVTTYTNYSTSDYNGFFNGKDIVDAFVWSSPDPAVARDYTKAPVVRKFPTLAGFARATGRDIHSRMVDYRIFERAAPPAQGDDRHMYRMADYDFRLRRGSAAVDAGTPVPNITDGHAGRAPDLGAYEHGRPIPHYGPRRRE